MFSLNGFKNRPRTWGPFRGRFSPMCWVCEHSESLDSQLSSPLADPLGAHRSCRLSGCHWHPGTLRTVRGSESKHGTSASFPDKSKDAWRPRRTYLLSKPCRVIHRAARRVLRGSESRKSPYPPSVAVKVPHIPLSGKGFSRFISREMK